MKYMKCMENNPGVLAVKKISLANTKNSVPQLTPACYDVAVDVI